MIDQQETIKQTDTSPTIIDQIKEKFTALHDYELAHQKWKQNQNTSTSEPEPQKPEPAVAAEFIKDDSYKFQILVESYYKNTFNLGSKNDSLQEGENDLKTIFDQIENPQVNEVDPKIIKLSRAAAVLDASKNYSFNGKPEIAKTVAEVVEKYPESLLLTDYADLLVNNLSSSLDEENNNFLKKSPLEDTTRILKVLSSDESPLVATKKEEASLLYHESVGYAFFIALSKKSPQSLNPDALSLYTKDILTSDQWSDILKKNIISVNEIPLLLAKSLKDIDLPSQEKNERKALALGYLRSMYDSAIPELGEYSPLERKKGEYKLDIIAQTLIKLANYDTSSEGKSFYIHISREDRHDPIIQDISNIYNLSKIIGNKHFETQSRLNFKRLEEERIAQENADEKAARAVSIATSKQEIKELLDFPNTNEAIEIFKKINLSIDPLGEIPFSTLNQLKESGKITETQYQNGQQILNELITYSQNNNLVAKEKQQRGNKGFLGIGNTLHEVTVIKLNVQEIQDLIKKLNDQKTTLEVPSKDIETKIIVLNLLSSKYSRN
ncbi:MAG: hypothetical protein PHR98_03570 [Candidatus Shapirobacteria bacterium]|jgi:hypothetical protein|nr:hypothetical protein [Candidatus Shapirobacteria bacterium]